MRVTLKTVNVSISHSLHTTSDSDSDYVYVPWKVVKSATSVGDLCLLTSSPLCSSP